MKKQPERTAKTKQSLRDSFWKLYQEKPMEKITVSEITTAAGVYRSTFYTYYSDVYAVLEEIEAGILESYTDFIDHIPDVHEISEDTMNLLIAFYTRHAEYLAVLLGPCGDPKFQDKIKNCVKSCIHTQLGAPYDDIETEIFVEMGAATVFSILNYWYAHRELMSVAEVIRISSNFLQHGLTTYLQKWLEDFEIRR